MIETTESMPFIVVGGGIGGLAAALALAQKGAYVRVLEQSPEFAEIGAGIQLGPNVFKMFERLNITDRVSKLAVYPETLVMLDSVTAEKVTEIGLLGTFRKRFKHPYALIHRADLHTALFETCQGLDRIALETSHQVTKIEDLNKGVTVHTAGSARYEAAAVIGADGLWSTMRDYVIGDGKPRPAGHICYRAVLPAHDMPEDLAIPSMVLWAGERTHLVHYPLRGGELYNLVAVFHSDRFEEGWDSYGDPEELHERFADKCEEVKTMLAKIEDWRMWVLCDREPVKEWSRGRVTLLGDAAHPMLQYLAQGACMAIEDAVVLADKLAEADDPAAAFVDYQNSRFFRTGRVQLTARLYGEFFHAAGTRRELRNIMLAARTPEEGLASVAWLYDGI